MLKTLFCDRFILKLYMDDTIDLRDTGHLNLIHNQGDEDCCYAFTACATIEFLHHRGP